MLKWLHINSKAAKEVYGKTPQFSHTHWHTGQRDGRGLWGTVRVIYGRCAEVPSEVRWLSLGQEMSEEWKIKTTLTSDTELMNAIKCHAQGTEGSVQIRGS